MRQIRTLLWVSLLGLLMVTSACVALEPASTGTLETVEESAAVDAPAAAPQPEGNAASVGELGGTTWSLLAFGDPSSLQAMASGSEITAEFSVDGRLSGTAGCNRYMTTFEVNGDQVAVGPVGLTRVMCADEAIRLQEQQFVGTLEQMADGRAFRLIADQLEIDLGSGSVLIFQTQ